MHESCFIGSVTKKNVQIQRLDLIENCNLQWLIKRQWTVVRQLDLDASMCLCVFVLNVCVSPFKKFLFFIYSIFYYMILFSVNELLTMCLFSSISLSPKSVINCLFLFFLFCNQRVVSNYRTEKDGKVRTKWSPNILWTSIISSFFIQFIIHFSFLSFQWTKLQ